MRANRLDTAAVVKAYVDDRLSLNECAERFNCSRGTIARALTKAGAPVRARSITCKLTPGERCDALYKALCDWAERKELLPNYKVLRETFHIDPATALQALHVDGRVLYDAERSIGSTVTIVATGQTVATRQNVVRNHVKRARQRKSAAARKARSPMRFRNRPHSAVLASDQSIWGALASDVLFLRSQGDAIERHGIAQAKINGRVIDRVELADRAERIRARCLRMKAPQCAAFAVTY